jgi:hypothetical protein
MSNEITIDHQPYFYLQHMVPDTESGMFLYDNMKELLKEVKRLVEGGVAIQAGVRWMTEEEYEDLPDTDDLYEFV